jgi:hypothetical protein
VQQLGMFSGSCPHHGPENVCNLCPERPWTDGWGFPHRIDASGRVPLKECKVCRTLVKRENWHVARWCCKTCAGLGGLKG